MTRRKRFLTLILSAAVLLAGGLFALLAARVTPAIRVGAAVVSQTLCGGVFVSGLESGRVFAEELQPRAGMRTLFKRLHYTVDNAHRRVVATWAGHFAAVATFHDGYGCTLGNANFPAPTLAPPAPEIPATSIAPASAKLAAALDLAFAEPSQPPYRRVRAIVVMRDGKIVAERYAPGIGPDTPLIGYSVSKSVIHALWAS